MLPYRGGDARVLGESALVSTVSASHVRLGVQGRLLGRCRVRRNVSAPCIPHSAPFALHPGSYALHSALQVRRCPVRTDKLCADISNAAQTSPPSVSGAVARGSYGTTAPPRVVSFATLAACHGA